MSPEFDTSGEVLLQPSKEALWETPNVRWSDLSLGVQGCLRAASEEASRILGRPVGFSDWSGEAVARIIADWERWTERVGKICFQNAAWFWASRQKGLLDGFPPLLPTLNDQGLVCLKENVA